jgi:hypothetical protein
VGELGIALSVVGVIVGYLRTDAALITAALALGLASSLRSRRAQ